MDAGAIPPHDHDTRPPRRSHGDAAAAQAIPDPLRRAPQWLPFRLQPQGGGRPRKVPVDSHLRTPLRAWTDPSHWLTHPAAAAAAPASGGVGYVLSADDPYLVLDGDDCRDPASGDLEPWAREVVHRLASYAEVSVSGTGIHVWVLARLPEGAPRCWPAPGGRGKLELYHGPGRFIAVSGRHLAGTPATIEERQVELDALLAGLGGEGRATGGGVPGAPIPTGAPGSSANTGGMARSPLAGEVAAVREWLEAYSRAHPPGADRSASFCALVRSCYRAHGAVQTRAYADRINALTGGHHPTREAATRDLDRILLKFGYDRQEDQGGSRPAGPPVPPDPGELVALRQRLQAAEARADRAEAERDAAHAALAGCQIGQTWERHEYALQAERARRRQLIALAERGDLSYRDRVITMLAMDETDAYVLPRAAGEDRPAPRRLNVGAFKRRLGLAPTSNAPAEALAAAAGVGVITRSVETEPTNEEATDWRATVYIGPGTGSPAPVVTDDRRARDASRHAARKAQLAERMALIQRAAQRAAQGCPSCGGDLHACEWVCGDCTTQLGAAALAGEPEPADGVEPCPPPSDQPTDSVALLGREGIHPTESVGCPGDRPPCAGGVEEPDSAR